MPLLSEPTKSLSTMSREQASQLKDLENEYEEILDENCKVFATYFNDVLLAKSQDKFIDPPTVIVQKSDCFEFSKDEEMINQDYGLKNRPYKVMLYYYSEFYLNFFFSLCCLHYLMTMVNCFDFYLCFLWLIIVAHFLVQPIWTDSVERDKSVMKLNRSSKEFSKFLSFYPERVSLKALTSQRSSIKSKPSNFDLEHESCSSDDSNNLCSNESKAENEVTG